jgi:acetylglutamate kinase
VLFAEKTYLNGPDGRRNRPRPRRRSEAGERAAAATARQADSIPVIATIARDDAGSKLNVNADTAAGAVAASMKAEKLVVVSDTHGIYRDLNDPTSRVSHLTTAEIDDMVKSGVISKGMLPKVEACVQALQGGVNKTHIIDGRIRMHCCWRFIRKRGLGRR